MLSKIKPKSRPIEMAKDQEAGNQSSPGLCQHHPMSLDVSLFIQVCFTYNHSHSNFFFFACCLDCVLAKTGLVHLCSMLTQGEEEKKPIGILWPSKCKIIIISSNPVYLHQVKTNIRRLGEKENSCSWLLQSNH